MGFIKPENIIAQVKIKPDSVVADLGCGAGFYALAAAKVLGGGGMVYALDVQETKLIATQSAARHQGLRNIETKRADLDELFTGLKDGTCDLVILASIIHEVDNKEMLFKNAYRLLKTGGELLVVDWKKEITPFGPDIDRRVSLAKATEMLEKFGLRPLKEIETDGYHYAYIFKK